MQHGNSANTHSPNTKTTDMTTNTKQPLPLSLLRSMRPVQWIKNLLLFAGIVFSHNLGDPSLILRAICGFALFCLISGAIYIFNDLVDIENDRRHPTKKNRPLAAGDISPAAAIALALVSTCIGLGGSFYISILFGTTALLYFILTMLYTLYFKHIALTDVILLALGFVLRAIGGVFVLQTPDGPIVPMTPWFIICVFFLSLFIAVCKRRHELVELEGAKEHRAVLGQYNSAFLDQIISISAGSTIISYALYLVAELQKNGDGTPQSQLIIATLPFVIYGVFRYLLLVFKGREGGEPDKLILKDKPLLLNAVAWLIIMIVLHKPS